MKKFKNLFICFVFTLFAFFGCFSFQNAQANASTFVLSHSDYSSQVMDILNEFCQYKTRIAGSENETLAAEYIRNYLDTNTELVAKSNMSTINGVQEFQFINQYTGIYNTSQNIIFTYTSAETTDKKVILCCNYDAPMTYDSEKQEYVSYNNDALNVSAASVASLLMLAKTLPQLNLKYNLEFVFFGAGENDFAGSEFYLNGLSKEAAENVLCVINIDKVAVGENLYFYIDEVSTDFSDFVAKTCSGFASEIDVSKLNVSGNFENKLGLDYSHIALTSDNVNFMSEGIATINLFAGYYENNFVLGLNEYSDKNVISYSKNDTIEYINENYKENTITDNLFKVSCAIESLLGNGDFMANAAGTYNQTSWFYKIFANQKLVVLVTTIAFFVFVIIAMFVYYKLTIKSYYADVEVEFLSSVVKISDQIDQDNIQGDVAGVVGKVIAKDIKKDKTLNPEKKKKDKEN